MPPIPTARSMGRSSNGYGNGIYGIPPDEAEHFDENGEKTPLHQDAYSRLICFASMFIAHFAPFEILLKFSAFFKRHKAVLASRRESEVVFCW